MHRFNLESEEDRHGTDRAGKGASSEGENPTAADPALRAGHQERQPDLPLLRDLPRPVLLLAAALSAGRLPRTQSPEMRSAAPPLRDATAHRCLDPPGPP